VDTCGFGTTAIITLLRITIPVIMTDTVRTMTIKIVTGMTSATNLHPRDLRPLHHPTILTLPSLHIHHRVLHHITVHSRTQGVAILSQHVMISGTTTLEILIPIILDAPTRRCEDTQNAAPVAHTDPIHDT